MGCRDAVCARPALSTRALFPVASPLAGWWGAARFVSAGSLEGAKKDVKGGKDRMTFNEADQVGGWLGGFLSGPVGAWVVFCV